MSFSAAMLALSVWAFVVSLHLNSLEGGGFFGSALFVLAMLAGMSVFALLTAAHAVCLLLRHTVWSGSRDRENAATTPLQIREKSEPSKSRAT